MSDKNYEELINILEEMIESKVQLIYGGQLIDWDDVINFIKIIK